MADEPIQIQQRDISEPIPQSYSLLDQTDKFVGAAKNTPATKDEFNRLLDLADQLDTRCTENARSIRSARLWQVAGLVVAILFAIIQIIPHWQDIKGNWDNPRLSDALAISFFLGLLGYVVAVEETTVRSDKRDLKKDRRALHEVVAILREVESTFAESHVLSTLERAEHRIRLSRFDIGDTKSLR